ncbi:MAG TPA: carboxypeptidase-like regulatory domain-containing protein [Planctomycetota bacterium]|nr:carboxypeptidase-like regulatory domain-containing protein [Planctomycetota bacterium]
MGKAARDVAILLVACAAGAVLALTLRSGPPPDAGALAGDDAAEGATSDESVVVPIGLPARLGASRTPSAAGTGALQVRVLRAPDLAPVPNAPVILNGSRENGTPTSRIGWTDDRGVAVVESVPVGTWAVRIQPSAEPPVDRGDVAIRNQETTVLDDVVLTSAGIIDGMVFDEDREPIAGVDVVATLDPDLVRGTDADPWPPTTDVAYGFARLKTDDRGRFRLEGIPPGLVAVRVAAPWLRGATDRVLVPPEPPRTGWVRFVLKPGHRAMGMIVDLSGEPVAEARVEMGERDRGEFVPRLATLTSEDGRFEVAGFGVLPGVDLLVTPPRGASAAFDAIPFDTDVRLTVGAATGAQVRVTVLAAETKAPIPGAVVRLPLRPAAKGAWDVGHVDVETDEFGQATVDVAPGTRFACEAWHPGFRPAILHPGRDGRLAADGTAVAGDLERPLAQNELRGITLFLRAPLAVRGQVVDAAGNGMPRAHVVLAHAVGSDAVDTIADVQGRFRFDGVVPEGKATLEAVGPWGAWSEAMEIPVPAVGVTEMPPVTLKIREQAASADGVVVGALGRPVAGARVSIEDGPEARTDAEGRYRLVGVRGGSAPTGRTVELTAMAEGIGWAVGEVAVIEGQLTHAPPLRLIAGVDVRGVVTVPGGDRARFPVLEVFAPDGSGPLRVSCGEEFGDFLLRALPPGGCHVRARTRGMAGAVTARLELGVEPPFAPIRMAPLREVAVRVVDAKSGDPIAGVEVSIESLRGSVPAHTDPDLLLEVTTMATDVRGEALLSTQKGEPRRLKLELSLPRKGKGKGVRWLRYEWGEVDIPDGVQGLVIELSERASPVVRGPQADDRQTQVR